MLAVYEVEVALISSAALVLVAGLGLIGVLVQTRRTGRKVDAVYDHVNRVEESIGPDGGPEHRTFREEVRDGFRENVAAHEALRGALVAHERRIEVVEREVGL